MYGVCALASEFLIGNSTVNYMMHYPEKASQIRDVIVFGCAIVEAEHLFIYVPIQMEWFDADICSLQSALEQTPKVFDAVRMETLPLT